MLKYRKKVGIDQAGRENVDCTNVPKVKTIESVCFVTPDKGPNSIAAGQEHYKAGADHYRPLMVLTGLA